MRKSEPLTPKGFASIAFFFIMHCLYIIMNIMNHRLLMRRCSREPPSEPPPCFSRSYLGGAGFLRQLAHGLANSDIYTSFLRRASNGIAEVARISEKLNSYLCRGPFCPATPVMMPASVQQDEPLMSSHIEPGYRRPGQFHQRK